MSSKTESEQILGKVEGFIRIHARLLIIIVCLIIAFFISFLVIKEVVNKTNETAMNRIYALEEDFKTFSESSDKNAENSADLISGLENEIKKGTVYSSSRAAFLLGRLYVLLEDYENAIKSFSTVTDKQKNSYLACISYFDLGEVYSLTDNPSEAVLAFSKCAECDVEFGFKAKAYLNMGALEEKMGDMDLAKTYMEMAAEYSSYSEYGKMAENWLILH